VPSEPERLFEKADADALLPRLRGLINRLQEVATSQEAVAARRRLAHVGQSNGSAEAAAAAFQASADLRTVLDEIRGLGVILRDPATGLCDFPALRGGEPVYLCWQLEETEVGWWHPRDTGIAGRQPL